MLFLRAASLCGYSAASGIEDALRFGEGGTEELHSFKMVAGIFLVSHCNRNQTVYQRVNFTTLMSLPLRHCCSFRGLPPLWGLLYRPRTGRVVPYGMSNAAFGIPAVLLQLSLRPSCQQMQTLLICASTACMRHFNGDQLQN
jgi:hypothetical protein